MRAALIVLAMLIASAPARAQRLSFDPKVVYAIPRGSSPAVGPVDAPVTIVVWSDYACGYCNHVQGTLGQLDALFPGQLRWVHRTLPLDDDNTITAEAALAAAAQGKFLPMHDRLFGMFGRVDRVGVELIARELGLDMVRFRADLDTHAWRAAIAADVADARRIGVNGTPTFFVNGRPVHGNQPLKVFVDTVEEELARANAARAAGATGDLYAKLVGGGPAIADAPADAGHARFELDSETRYKMGLGLPGHQLGPDTALVTIVEWSDFQCPYCAKNVATLAHVIEKYGDQVRIIYRHMPMEMHHDAELAAEAAVAAAAQGKFWAFHDQVFGNFGKLTRADLDRFAVGAGLDIPRFRAALDERRYHDEVAIEAAAGAALGIDGTPTMFVNGIAVIGARTPVEIDRLIDIVIDGANHAVAKGLEPRDVYGVVMSMAQGVERADPSTVPNVTAVGTIELQVDERARVLEAACRRRDPARAAALAPKLAGEARQRAAAVCAGEGIDLAPAP